MLEKAIELAKTYHEGQIKQDTGELFIFHCLRVMLKMDTEEEKIAAVLHDIIEKTNINLNDLEKLGFPSTIIDAIDTLSKREGEKYSVYINRVKTNPLAVKVKIADLEDNMDLRYIKTIDPSTKEKLNRRKKYWKELKELIQNKK